ncbi:helix-turn-helix domain-containing protein [Moorella sulfitireducens (nom. illeg.)]|uniref:helix-turn-helix domain-containing protein n=1 Tax=Neomoorella sulfitireducens TaxID=2972948 RepID=UPI0021ABA4B4|nr:helix-turn-helix domain-containing protein [Moorella sulfitireducens]
MEPTFKPARVPWSTRPGLKEMAAEAGVDYDRFLAGLAANRSDTELAAELGVDSQVIFHLRDHFERYGIHSITGQD